MNPLEDVARAIDRYLIAETLFLQLQGSGYLASNVDVGGLAFDYTVALFGEGIALNVFKSIVKGMVEGELASAANGYMPPVATAQRSQERANFVDTGAASLLEARNLASQLALIPKHGTSERLALISNSRRQKNAC
ncbi:hypothetical protein [Massilia sp. TWR1-2-2]|uniref:hypothetical protein n=1 Tax=Massilia sp. TWR1-2-2 TaxID=2804584 RepID=UPI003CEEC08B